MVKNTRTDGYRETIQLGIQGVRKITGQLSYGHGTREERIAQLAEAIRDADAIVIGAGAGLSTSAGHTYSGERFRKHFSDFAAKYGITDMYSGGFYPFPEKEIFWAWWARHIYYNRYCGADRPVYENLLELLQDKDYFVITTNVDHMFQRAGFDKSRLFYTQGDYGLFQSVNPMIQQTFDNEEWVMEAMSAMGFEKDEEGIFQWPREGAPAMRIPTELIPSCPIDGSAMTTNLRADDSFVEDEGWQAASEAYSTYLMDHMGQKILYLELGVGANTPVIIKYPFWVMTLANPNATYACLNYDEAVTPVEIDARSICIDGDTGAVFEALLK